MSCVKMVSVGLSAATLIFLFAGGPELTGAENEGLKEYTFYPGIGFFQKFTTSAANWTDAFQGCKSSGGSLAVPNSEEEAEVYKQIIAETVPPYKDIVFIGFHDLFVNGDHETIHDYPVAKSGYTEWAVGYPNNDSALSCGGFSGNGGLVELKCSSDSDAMYICEQPLWADYEKVPDLGYYKFHVDAKSWPEAWQVCRDEGSHLVVVNSEEEQDVLQDIFARYPNLPEANSNLYVWVGVHSQFGRYFFQTVLSTSLDEAGYSTWEVGYPDAGINAMYEYVALTRNNGSLIMRPTTHKLAFFCEHEL